MGAWDGGSTRRWRTIRAAVLAENQRTNNGNCTLHIDGVCEGQATAVHHVLGRAVTGDDPRYLVAACKACNEHIGKPGPSIPHKRVSNW